MVKNSVLIIDDEPQITRLLTITLESLDYKILSASSLKEGITSAAINSPDIILLDIGLPDGSGLDGLVRLREWYTGPIMMLTVLDDEDNLVTAFENGANDYLTKPYRSGELIARVRSLLKNNISNQEIILTSNDISIDLAGKIVTKNGEQVKLTATEYQLLAILAKNQGRIVTHSFLLKEVWGPTFQEESNYLRVFFAQLRKKLEDDPTNPVHIITEPRIGYRFV
jgi:two-component system KDP operon response regulator KdpE